MFETPEFWVAVGFVILVVGIARPVARAMTSGLDARSARIRAALDEARILREEAQHLLAEYQRKQRDAAREAESMIEQARAEAGRIAAEAAASLDRAVERREALARAKIAQAEADAVREVRNVAIDVAIAATGRVIADHLGEDRAGALVDEAAAELPRQFNQAFNSSL